MLGRYTARKGVLKGETYYYGIYKMLYLTGDMHGILNIHKLSGTNWPEQKLLSKNDYLIILGDFGLIWNPKETDKERYWLDWLDNKPFTTLFIDGNHENFDRLCKFPEVDMFGDSVGRVSESVFHLKRGKIYTINNFSIFTFGGGLSVDKEYRTPGISWWPQEYPSREEIDRALDNLSRVGWSVDYVFTHTGPKTVVDEMIKRRVFKSITATDKMNDSVSELLDQLLPLIEFKVWYMAHYHVDLTLGKFRVLYNDIIKLNTS